MTRIRTTLATTAVAALLAGPLVSGAASAATVEVAPPVLRSTAAPISLAVAEPLLGRGDVGDRVRAWQVTLNSWIAAQQPDRAAIAVDGVFGPVTERTTRDLQRFLGVADDGIVGPETRAAATIEEPTPEPPAPQPDPAVTSDLPDGVLAPGDTGADVMVWQNLLNTWRHEKGFDLILVDGVYGPDTAEATRTFQRAFPALANDGVYGPDTASAAAAAGVDRVVV